LSYSVLMMLGLGYFMALCLVLYARLRAQVVITIAVLLGYWLVQMGIPFPGRTPGQFTAGGIFGDWLYDVTIGKLDAPWKSRYGRGMLISVWNHGATAMLGVFAGRLLRGSAGSWRAARLLLLGGVALLLAGWLWSFYLPIVKNRWSSSYVLWCGGLSWILLAVFYAVIDLAGWRKWAALFTVLGANSIVAYLISTRFMTPFKNLAEILFGGLSLWLPPAAHAVWMTLASYGFAWMLLAFLHRQKIHLRL
jgi:predicted acyltransferase